MYPAHDACLPCSFTLASMRSHGVEVDDQVHHGQHAGADDHAPHGAAVLAGLRHDWKIDETAGRGKASAGARQQNRDALAHSFQRSGSGACACQPTNTHAGLPPTCPCPAPPCTRSKPGLRPPTSWRAARGRRRRSVRRSEPHGMGCRAGGLAHKRAVAQVRKHTCMRALWQLNRCSCLARACAAVSSSTSRQAPTISQKRLWNKIRMASVDLAANAGRRYAQGGSG